MTRKWTACSSTVARFEKKLATWGLCSRVHGAPPETDPRGPFRDESFNATYIPYSKRA